MVNALKDFLEIPYDKLEEMNLKAKASSESATSQALEKEYSSWLKKEKRVKAVTLCFSDIEGRLHMLDYDKKFLLDSLLSVALHRSMNQIFVLMWTGLQSVGCLQMFLVQAK
jgi:hypothetical protein